MLIIRHAYALLTKLLKFMNVHCNQQLIVLVCGLTIVASVCPFLRIHLMFAGKAFGIWYMIDWGLYLQVY